MFTIPHMIDVAYAQSQFSLLQPSICTARHCLSCTVQSATLGDTKFGRPTVSLLPVYCWKKWS